MEEKNMKKTYLMLPKNLRRTVAEVAIKYGLEFQSNNENEEITIWGERSQMEEAMRHLKKEYGIIG